MSSSVSIEKIDLDLCLSMLNFIATIPEGHKPCYKSKTTVSKHEWFVTWKRRWKGEKGELGIIYVKKILTNCDRIYKDLLGESERLFSNRESLRKLSTSLKNSVEGFNNLITTYRDQPSVSKDYEECKSLTISLYTGIDKSLRDLLFPKTNNNSLKRIKEDLSNMSSDSTEEDDDYYDYPTPWESEKKPTVISLDSYNSDAIGFFNVKDVRFKTTLFDIQRQSS